jgi:hypothetical protein
MEKSLYLALKNNNKAGRERFKKLNNLFVFFDLRKEISE